MALVSNNDANNNLQMLQLMMNQGKPLTVTPSDDGNYLVANDPNQKPAKVRPEDLTAVLPQGMVATTQGIVSNDHVLSADDVKTATQPAAVDGGSPSLPQPTGDMASASEVHNFSSLMDIPVAALSAVAMNTATNAATENQALAEKLQRAAEALKNSDKENEIKGKQDEIKGMKDSANLQLGVAVASAVTSFAVGFVGARMSLPGSTAASSGAGQATGAGLQASGQALGGLVTSLGNVIDTNVGGKAEQNKAQVEQLVAQKQEDSDQQVADESKNLYQTVQTEFKALLQAIQTHFQLEKQSNDRTLG